ncbi:ABC transporter substrate-binding protein [Marinobacter santoriniensis NKSG1]|uniref:ABC transporter substrate-binding protein n=1 Tax=Marinobacter santoriniensis NKSG1 TaxID=1288826 RepID=M7CPP7_9GAMM|nr:ABC transporter substrate-binding protein [Marinobacter santoriniensis]EMP55144.1 ABC transporter substrate-binding protein [Marinobacter santoriniensis NKSG1]
MTTMIWNTFLAVVRLPLALALLLFANTSPALANDGPLPELSLSVLQFGTAHWELDQVQHRGLDTANGYRLVVHAVANLSASRLAVASGSVDGAVADLLWVQHRYRDGQSYLYVPFSSQIGQVVVPENSDIHGVADLSGRRIGVAGGPDSKGWVLLKAVAERQGVKLGGRDQVQYGSPPLLNQALKRGQVDAIVTYWHFAARLQGQGGWRTAFRMSDLLESFHLDPDLPVLGYVFPERWAETHTQLVASFARSIRQARTGLAANPDQWQRLHPLMRASSPAVLQALHDGFLAGTPRPLTDRRIADLQTLIGLTGGGIGEPLPAHLFFRDPRE